MPVGATIATAGLSAGSSVMQANAAKDAGKDQARASKQAAALQDKQFQQILGLQMPSYRLGQAAQGVFASALGLPGFSIMQSGYPGYSDPTPPAATPGTAAQQGHGALFNAAQRARGEPADPVTPATPAAPTGALANYQGPASGTLQSNNDATLTSILGGTNIPDIVRNQPGYQTQVDEGTRAITGSAAASGGLRSGATLKAVSDYGQHTFGGYYDKWLGNVGSLAGFGRQAADNIGQAGQANATNQGNLLMQGANARAQGTLGAANAWAEGLGGAAGALGAYPFGGAGGAGAGSAAHSTTNTVFPGF